MDLSGKTILVAGGAGRLGIAISKAILAHGGNVTIADVKETTEVNSAIQDYPDRAGYFDGDITVPEIADAAIQAVLKRFGSLDGAVQSAYPRSAGWGAKFENLTAECLAEDLQKQLGGTILFSQRVTAALKANGGGALVLISSIQGLSAPKFRHYTGTSMTSPIEYSAIKAGVNAVARYLAKYLKEQNIRVNTVSPGGILDQQPETFLEGYREECINKGMLDPEDVVGTVCFLLSDDSLYINGQNIVVDDGWSL